MSSFIEVANNAIWGFVGVNVLVFFFTGDPDIYDIWHEALKKGPNEFCQSIPKNPSGIRDQSKLLMWLSPEELRRMANHKERMEKIK